MHVYSELLREAVSGDTRKPWWFARTRGCMSGILMFVAAIVYLLSFLFYPVQSPFANNGPLYMLLGFGGGMGVVAVYGTPRQMLGFSEAHCILLVWAIVYICGHIMGFVVRPNYAVMEELQVAVLVFWFWFFYVYALYLSQTYCEEIEQDTLTRIVRQTKYATPAARHRVTLYLREVDVTAAVIQLYPHAPPLWSSAFFVIWKEQLASQYRLRATLISPYVLPDIALVISQYC